MGDNLASLLSDIRSCTTCAAELTPRPILVANSRASILIVGQAPGARVHESGIAWDDPSGARLREWMGVSSEVFYDPHKVALVPMGFCYPGKGKSGDLPPRKECADQWHPALLPLLKNVKLTLSIGQYSQAYLLGEQNKKNLTETVLAWRDFAPELIPLPHPSPRNNRWLARNPWFQQELVPAMQRSIQAIHD